MTPPWPPAAPTRAIHGLLRELRRGGAGDDEAFVRRVMRALEQPAPVAAPGDRGGAGGRIGWPRWLALAAGLALAVAGGLWVYPRLAGAPALGLRLVELQGAVAVTRAGQTVPVSQGLALHDGDGVTVPEGGKAVLQYEGEDTRIALHSATASFRTEQGTKRVKLDAGLLVCTAAPQRQPFRLETPHAIAEVVGTRFWLETTVAQTTLAVQEGSVALRQTGPALHVRAGETAVAAAAGMRKLSPADTWIRELLVRAETGPWDVVNLGIGVFAADVWRMDARGSPAQRRLWNVRAEANRTSIVVFDRARWQRGVVVGRLTILPEGAPPQELAAPAAMPNPPWAIHGVTLSGPAALPGVGVLLSRGPREKAEGTVNRLLTAAGHARGVPYRCVLYFDLAAPGGAVILFAAWPAARGYPPPAADWTRATDNTTGPVGLGLDARGVLASAEGLKLVPLGPDMPPPPELRPEPRQ